LTRDKSLDSLLFLDGVSYVLDGPFWVRFEVKEVANTPEKPHGLDYSFTLHDGYGERILGFDNAHPIKEGTGPGARTRIEYDHTHKGERIRFYYYKDASTLLADFWNEVDRVLTQKVKKP
jgi:hypothetical protein